MAPLLGRDQIKLKTTKTRFGGADRKRKSSQKKEAHRGDEEEEQESEAEIMSSRIVGYSLSLIYNNARHQNKPKK